MVNVKEFIPYADCGATARLLGFGAAGFSRFAFAGWQKSRRAASSQPSDAYRPYLEGAVGIDVDCAMPVKVYGPSSEGQRRYRPPESLGAFKREIEGKPDRSKISTSYVERNSGIIRQHSKRYAGSLKRSARRLTTTSMLLLCTPSQLRQDQRRAPHDPGDEGWRR